MSHQNAGRLKSTAQDPGESTTNTSNESAPYVCNHDDCFAAFGSTEARDEHEASDHDGDAATEVGA